MLLFIILAFSGSTANEARAHISELYDVLLSPTDVNALSVFITLCTSEAVTVSYARVPLIVTGVICLLARYFVAFCCFDAAPAHCSSFCRGLGAMEEEAPVCQTCRSRPFLIDEGERSEWHCSKCCLVAVVRRDEL